MKDSIKYMEEALVEAKKAYQLGETPIGCVILYKDKIIARAYNRRNTDRQTSSHAEMIAIRQASEVLEDWRLEGCTLYVTLEPCPMCAGAIVQARIDTVVIGSMSEKSGCAGSILNLLQEPRFNHQVALETGVLEEACQQLMTQFFQDLRKTKQEENREKPELIRALEVATKAHKGQVDKAGRDYIEHPKYVASLLTTPVEQTTALLHDVVEDTSLTIDNLKKWGFSPEVVEAVSCLTKDKKESYETYIKGVANNALATRVKIADLTHNMDTSRLDHLTANDRKRIAKYKWAKQVLEKKEKQELERNRNERK